MASHELPRAELERLELFAAADLSALEPALRSCAVRNLNPGEVLIEAGRPNGQLYLVLSGQLTVHLDAADGPAIAGLAAGATAGEISLIDGEPASAFVVAAAPTRVLVVDQELVWILADSSHAVAYNLLRTLATRLRDGNRALAHNLEQLETYRFHATVDALTGLFNRRWLHKMLARLMERARGQSEPLSLLLIDIDHFKAFNDRHGHVAGDHALRAVAACLRGALRPTDMIARYGGEELAVLLPGASRAIAREIAERLRLAVRTAPITGVGGQPLPGVTVSIGVAQFEPGTPRTQPQAQPGTAEAQPGAAEAQPGAPEAGQDAAGAVAEGFIEQADRALYRAKASGRDRVA